jgi:hypothetical protein
MHAVAFMPALLGVAGDLPAWGEDLIVPLLILLVGLVFGVGITLLTLLAHATRRSRTLCQSPEREMKPDLHDRWPRWLATAPPPRWLAIRVNNPRLVQMALGLHHPMPCSWEDGLALAQEHKLFISPCVGGWVLVLGADLPDPAEDVDKCFVFLTGLSRKLGAVQFFSVSRVLNHHAWVLADRGSILRAYAWAGRTLWNQGHLTRAEKDLGMTCFDYAATVERIRFNSPDPVAVNTDRVQLLAARWSLDPTALTARGFRTQPGILGEISRSRIH